MAKSNGEVKEINYTSKDFTSDQDVRWCPGCGDYSILAQVQRTFPDIGIPKEQIVWVSGIGCSSRFPYYMETYGMHGIHGRATAIASGVKIARPELSVWVATGDGDLLSIGGNHFIHACRKNMDIKILLFNNQIYGLTKGQYSPTSKKGKISKSSPYGSIDAPFNPLSLALGANATFIARSIDRSPKHLQEMIKKAAGHKGTAFIEIYQNCNIFNDGAFEHLTSKDTRDDNVLILEHGKPMIFGSKRDKGIKFECAKPTVVSLDDGKNTINDIFVHDEFDDNPVRSYLLTHLSENPDFPTPIGVFRNVNRPCYDEEVQKQVDFITQAKGKGTLNDLLYTANAWIVS
jgi:2-oxoglutarate ferredoxin oxidoreductase subunit beta